MRPSRWPPKLPSKHEPDYVCARRGALSIGSIFLYRQRCRTFLFLILALEILSGRSQVVMTVRLIFIQDYGGFISYAFTLGSNRVLFLCCKILNVSGTSFGTFTEVVALKKIRAKRRSAMRVRMKPLPSVAAALSTWQTLALASRCKADQITKRPKRVCAFLP